MAWNLEPDEVSDAPPEERVRPSRPAAIELAAALLIVGGVLGLVGTIAAAPGLPAGTEPLVLITAALDVGAVVLGILVRFGRAWLVAVNYVAVLGFLDLTAAVGSGFALMLGIGNIVVVVILFLFKRWFDAMRQDRQARAKTWPGQRSHRTGERDRK